jgi:hypothetical protein
MAPGDKKRLWTDTEVTAPTIANAGAHRMRWEPTAPGARSATRRRQEASLPRRKGEIR